MSDEELRRLWRWKAIMAQIDEAVRTMPGLNVFRSNLAYFDNVIYLADPRQIEDEYFVIQVVRLPGFLTQPPDDENELVEQVRLAMKETLEWLTAGGQAPKLRKQKPRTRRRRSDPIWIMLDPRQVLYRISRGLTDEFAELAVVQLTPEGELALSRTKARAEIRQAERHAETCFQQVNQALLRHAAARRKLEATIATYAHVL